MPLIKHPKWKEIHSSGEGLHDMYNDISSGWKKKARKDEVKLMPWKGRTTGGAAQRRKKAWGDSKIRAMKDGGSVTSDHYGDYTRMYEAKHIHRKS
jgi:hypothetical protein